METAIGQSDLLRALGWAVFNSLWQMALLWVAYQFITTVFRIRQSSRKNSFAVFLLFSGFAWFVFTLIINLTGVSHGGDSYTGFMQVSGNNTVNSLLGKVLPIASVVYLVLLILPILNFIRNYRYVQIIRRYGLSRADAQWRMFVQRIAGQMGIKKTVHIWMSDLISSPVTIGYIKPVILLPIAAVNHLTPQQTEAVLLHELSHIMRYDYFINLLVKCIQAVLYFNPFVKAFAKIIAREREKSCDETVMQFQYEPHGYASALLVLEKAAHISRHSLTVAASDGRKSEFRQRIEWIMGIRKTPVFSFNKLAGVMIALVCFIGLNALLMMSKPVQSTVAGDSFSYLSSPAGFFTGDKTDQKHSIDNNIAENKKVTIVNDPRIIIDNPAVEQPAVSSGSGEAARDVEIKDADNPSLQFVYNLQNVVPTLNAEQEKQVQQALQESKRVIQETKWKEVEATIADAMTTLEKQQVREEYNKALQNSKIDWSQLGDKLRIAYDNIDWKVVNAQLDNAITAIKLDSLQNVYTIALHNLNELQRQLIKDKQPGVPDTDVTLGTVETAKKNMENTIKTIQSSRPRKIIRL